MYEYVDKTGEQLKAGLRDPKKTIGPSTKMPSNKDKLTDDEIQAVIANVIEETMTRARNPSRRMVFPPASSPSA
jgi:hypothetical protein